MVDRCLLCSYGLLLQCFLIELKIGLHLQLTEKGHPFVLLPCQIAHGNINKNSFGNNFQVLFNGKPYEIDGINPVIVCVNTNHELKISRCDLCLMLNYLNVFK